MPAPPQSAINAILAGQTRVTRRCEIYEADGVTPWAPAFTPRMTGGSVSVDYTRDERRNIDITLDNSDGLISHDPNGGLWYDKIIKLYRGVKYTNTQRQPNIAIIEATVGASKLPAYLSGLGFTNIYLFDASTVTINDVVSYDIVAASYEGTADITAPIAALLANAFALGITVLTVSPYARAATVPLIATLATTTTMTSGSEFLVQHSALGNPFADYEDYKVNTTGVPTYTVVSTAAVGSHSGATSRLTNNAHVYNGIALLYKTNTVNTAKWVHYHLPILDVNPGGNPINEYNRWHYNRDKFFNSVVDWLFSYTANLSWETQVGEFMIDNITAPRAPRTIQVTGRDYTKKLIDDDFDNALSFDPGQLVDDLISAIATNGGITKFRLGGVGAITSSTLSFDGATSRWAAIKAIADSSNVEVFFDAQGYLVTRPFFDPLTSPITLTLSVGGDDGNLVDWSESSNDSELYNRIVVSGTSQDSSITGNIYQGIAENHSPSSPTSIENLNAVRSYYYSSSFFTADVQCLAYAQSLLAYHALENFELDFSSIVFAWIEAGEIIECDLPDTAAGTPNRFLLTNFDIPMTLDAMSGVGKRVTIVG